MTIATRLVFAAPALAASVSFGGAQQMPAPGPHHPADGGAVQGQPPPRGGMARPNAMPAQPNGQGMMGGDVMRMMATMHGRMSMGMGPAAMHPSRHIEDEIAFLKAELHITDAQLPQWNTFAEALRGIAASQRTAMDSAMKAGGPTTGTATAPERIERHIAMLSTHFDVMKPLYAVLSDEPKDASLFDEATKIGRDVIWLRTFGDRFSAPAEGRPAGAPLAGTPAPCCFV